jgi:hypothetical protein
MLSPDKQSVVVTDIRMPFGSIVVFLVKLAFASIPALIIIYAVILGLVVVGALLLGGLGLLASATSKGGATPSAAASPTPAAAPSLTLSPAAAKGYATLRREDFGEAWPLTVDKARVWCEPGGAVLLISNQTIYAVNGKAVELFGGQYRAIDEIWAEDAAGAKKDMTPIIGEGTRLCQ